MNEGEWLGCTDPQKMLEFFRGKASDRKLRLFACACCRRAWRLMEDERSRRAVEAAEAMAEGVLTEPQRLDRLEDAYLACYQARLVQLSPGNAPGLARTSAAEAAELSLSPFGDDVLLLGAAQASADALAYEAASRVAPAADVRWRETFTTQDAEDMAWIAGWDAFQENDFFRTPKLVETASQADVFRCILGRPFRPVPTHPIWATPAVIGLATVIYAERVFDRMPILLDALEDAGCDNADILNHCRQPGEHYRGCWVLDAILGKS